MRIIKRNFTVMKATLAVVLLICGVFFAGIISQNVRYHAAIEDISAGRYQKARETLCSLEEGYRDRDALIEYIDVIIDYDPRDPASVYHSYRALNSLCSAMEEESLDSGITEACSDMGALYGTLGGAQGLG